jgi:hypothetical protein
MSERSVGGSWISFNQEDIARSLFFLSVLAGLHLVQRRSPVTDAGAGGDVAGRLDTDVNINIDTNVNANRC